MTTVHRFLLLRHAASLALLVTVLFAAALRGTQAQQPRPNIVIILADDLGYGDLGAYGAPRIRTPNLDRMAREGVRFTDFYACSPVCTPSRGALLTGRLPFRTGLLRVLGPGDRSGIREEDVTLAEALQSQGYATACVGKWHLGRPPAFLPTRHGFDSYFGLPYSNDMNPTLLLRNETVIEEPARLDTLTARYTDEATRFLRQNRDRPFFLYLAHTMPHTPLAASAPFLGQSPRGLYGDVVEELDWSVGQILVALQEMDLDRSTLVFFASDHGPALAAGARGGSAGPFRGGKGSVFEGGVRVPCIARWPDLIPAGRVQMQPAMLPDLFPTLIRLAGGQPPLDRKIDGRDITPLLAGTGGLGERDFFFFRGTGTLEAIRSGRWKYHRPQKLFDLQTDPGESVNLAAQFPEVAWQMEARIATLQRFPPETHVTLSSPPNAAGWLAGPVTVTLHARQNASGGMVRQITYGASGAQAFPATAHPGDTVSFEVAAEGQTTVYYFAEDEIGSVGPKRTVTVRIDTSPPTLTASASPPAGTWTNRNVTVRFVASDRVSGVARGNPPVVISTPGANQSASGIAVDRAGNSASAALTGISIDKTKPTSTAALSSPPDKLGFHRGNVTVRLGSLDPPIGSGIQDISFSARGAQTIPQQTISGASASLEITNAGQTTVTFYARDHAGNVEAAKTVTVRINRTPPPGAP